ncbi:hypothetical protein M011DRAFT_471389 [Sporormia fimetaria CBS 119925]|uniref:F-box domain-containing protein n=1 Tax=Sporormia fimetaria CBS 119925 TaxID=1340428 RepID=A0A6A6V0X5_9PLEO|nr:hypothetical protein M011DRAFT_471389 [Sporormia fimetaria CBS 119925]
MAECHLYKLPNELLLNILVPFQTPDLLPLTTLSHRIYALILRILQNRLLLTSDLHSHMLLLECYHPSARLTEPPFFCTYLGLLAPKDTSSGTATETESPASRLGKLRNTYSCFRPYRRSLSPSGRRVLSSVSSSDKPSSSSSPPRSNPATNPIQPVPGTTSDTSPVSASQVPVKQVLSLESHELFTQLVAQLILVRLGRPGIYNAFEGFEEGVIRVQREWLKDRASSSSDTEGPEVDGDVQDDTCILWVNEATKNMGFRFKVKRREERRRDSPILVRVDEEEEGVTYEIEYDELLIRTSHLLLTWEKSVMQDDNSGKAVVFGSFG